MTHIFPVRHLSPRAAHELLAFCEAARPGCVLIEAPGDATDILRALAAPEVTPPAAILAYTDETLTRSFTLPLAEYSPEYAAVRFAAERGIPMECVDLPFSAALAFPPPSAENGGPSAYDLCARAAGEADFDTYFEACFEHGGDYRAAMTALGETLRALAPPDEYTLMRERYMRRRVRAAEARGYPGIVLVCGAWHAPALDGGEAMSDMEYQGLPHVECALTLIPGSYPKLTGGSAGNRSPGYHELLWKHRHDRSAVPAAFLSGVASHLREEGRLEASAAAVADAVTLARALASMRGRPPVLEDLRGAAVTVLGRGRREAVADALRAMEIGEKTGSVPPALWRSPLQDDFLRHIRRLKLTRFLTGESAALALDLRAVPGSEPLARRRSAFLHRLRALEVPFAVPETASPSRELWTLRCTPETDIALTEAVTRGVTVEAAAAAALEAALAEAGRPAEIAGIAGQALRCDLSAPFAAACGALGGAPAHSDDFTDTVYAADALDRVLQTAPHKHEALTPLLRRLCLRACLALPAGSRCGDARAVPAAACVQTLHRLYERYADPEELDAARWRGALGRLAESTEANPRLSGLAFALRLERGGTDADALAEEIYRRLSPASSVERAAGWLDGLASRNRRALLETPGLWERLDDALAGLDEDRFRRALVPLRRMFAGFSARDRRDIAARLAARWGLVSGEAAGPAELSREERETLAELRELEFF
ncbi:MAG: DUF5682 family protein [Oscillospiraceae bacterium]|nr:DUF5682 family protein [Oscillospiraceae bacterium]